MQSNGTENPLISMLFQHWHLLLILVVIMVASPFIKGKKKSRGRKRSNVSKTKRQTDKSEWVQKSAAEIGLEGEMALAAVLEKRGLSYFHDSYLAVTRGHTQIDHIVLAGQAIVVIECKRIAGNITPEKGKTFEESRNWTRWLGNKPDNFLNPLSQNAGHVSAVKQIAPKAIVESLVVFVGESRFPKEMPRDVIHLEDLDKWLAVRKEPNGHCLEAWRTIKANVEANNTPEIREGHLTKVTRGSRKAWN